MPRKSTKKQPEAEPKPVQEEAKLYEVSIQSQDGFVVAKVFGASEEIAKQNMRRIVACVQACDTVPTETLETGVIQKALHLLHPVSELSNKFHTLFNTAGEKK